MILWTKLFLEEQGYGVEKNILYQDNKSAILLETNGRKSAGKRSRALNIRYFFLTDQQGKGNLQIEYCPTVRKSRIPEIVSTKLINLKLILPSRCHLHHIRISHSSSSNCTRSHSLLHLLNSILPHTDVLPDDCLLTS